VADKQKFASAKARVGNGGREGLIEKICKLLCVAGVIVMLVVIGEDVVSRTIWNSSLEISDEIGGYMLVAVTFLGLPLAKTHGAFHKTDFFQSHVPRNAQIVSRIMFDLLSLGVALILLWQYFRYAETRFLGGNTAPTKLGTPQWIPAVPMVLGMAAYALAITKSVIGNVRAFGSPPSKGGSAWNSE
jgi:TRAP-type C4-dicarboxylate transport system permease small subunit